VPEIDGHFFTRKRGYNFENYRLRVLTDFGWNGMINRV